MDMKSYQKKIIADLIRYLELLNETQNSGSAFEQFWCEKSAPSLGTYQDILPGVPNLCFKIPTGGGKTFIACNALRPIFDALPVTKTKTVVWLVPSEAILAQTVMALKDARHPYRQKINVDFSGRVEVYTKEELLNGQSFNSTVITEQLSIMVLSYDSFRGRGKEGLKAYQENSSLANFAKALGKPENPIKEASDSALFQIINQLSPLVIVDESHHARSDLSIEMLKNFNPCFVLDLTATPKKESNIISYVDAVQLKNENMVKLPVIVYNRDTQAEVLTDAIDLRNKLEEIAVTEQERTGRYIRPIVLFQAQPKGKEEATTFEKLRQKLIDAGIPAGHIAIRTADINELNNVDLMSSTCQVRYIITVNALKEGWDCPFAYILASLANKTSQVDVEQVLGRILRLPYTVQHGQPALNMSYVLTSSNDFDETVQHIILGLNSAGFSNKECRISNPISLRPAISDAPHRKRPADCATNEALQNAESMLTEAELEGQAYDEARNGQGYDPYLNALPWEVRDRVTTFYVQPKFQIDVENLLIPQFFQVIPESLFTEETFELLEKEQLAESFTLKGKAYDIDFRTADDEIAKVDVRQSEGGMPKVFKMSGADQRFFKGYFSNLPLEGRVRQCKEMVFSVLNKMNIVDAVELRSYIDLIIGMMDKSQLAAMEKTPLGFAAKIKSKIESLLTEHYKETFSHWLETERIICRPSYRLPICIHPMNSTDMIGGALYQAEEDMNQLEQDLVMELTALPNIRWWHRNIAMHGFCINGFINHYPDIMVMTNSGKVLLVETKGEHLKNDDTLDKLSLGQAWRSAAGNQFRYYMVFADDAELLPGAVSIKQFVDIAKEL